MQIDFKHILLHRGYLIHWSLFLLKDAKSGPEAFLDLVFKKEYYSLIETSFYNLFKYLVVLAVISKSKTHIKRLKMTLEGLAHEDPFVKLFKSMFFEFDLESSFSQVKDCAKIIKSDYFLCEYEQLFLTKTREILLQNYIQLNSSIEVSTFSSFLGMDAKTTQTYLNDFFKIQYPEAVLALNNDTLTYLIPDADTHSYVISYVNLINL